MSKPIELKADPKNPNRMSAEDKARMAKSLAEFGDISGITINRRTGLLVCGHQRADALKGYTLDVTDLDKQESDGTVARGHLVLKGKRYSVRVVDWPEEKAHAALLAANRFGRVGQDDETLLSGLLEDIGAAGIDTDLTGFDAAALGAVIQQDSKENESKEKITSADMAEDNPKLKAFIERREASRERGKDKSEVNFWLCMVFQSYEQKMEFLNRFEGLETKYGMYVDGEVIAERIGKPLTPNTQKPILVPEDKTLSGMVMQ